MKHELKTQPEYFQSTWVGDKTFEIRFNDRNYKERDEIVLQEWIPPDMGFTGREIEGFIRYMTSFEQKEGWVVFSIEVTGKNE